MKRTGILVLALVAVSLVSASTQAGVVALKRTPGLTDNRGLSSVFQSAITGGTVTVCSGQTMVADADLWTGTAGVEHAYALDQTKAHPKMSQIQQINGTCYDNGNGHAEA